MRKYYAPYYRTAEEDFWQTATAIILFIGIMCICFGSLAWWFDKGTFYTEVGGKYWQYDAVVETLTTLRQEGWDETIPSDAFNQICNRRTRGGHMVGKVWVTDHDNYCWWDVNRWLETERFVEKGSIEDPFQWAEIRMPYPGDCVGCQRVVRYERYRIFFDPIINGKAQVQGIYYCDVSKEVFLNQYPVESHWWVDYWTHQKKLDCDTVRLKKD